MKIRFEKVRNDVSTVVRKQISFLCFDNALSFLYPLFIHLSLNTASCHRLSVNNFEWKIKPSFELGT